MNYFGACPLDDFTGLGETPAQTRVRLQKECHSQKGVFKVLHAAPHLQTQCRLPSGEFTQFSQAAPDGSGLVAPPDIRAIRKKAHEDFLARQAAQRAAILLKRDCVVQGGKFTLLTKQPVTSSCEIPGGGVVSYPGSMGLPTTASIRAHQVAAAQAKRDAAKKKHDELIQAQKDKRAAQHKANLLRQDCVAQAGKFNLVTTYPLSASCLMPAGDIVGYTDTTEEPSVDTIRQHRQDIVTAHRAALKAKHDILIQAQKDKRTALSDKRTATKNIGLLRQDCQARAGTFTQTTLQPLSASCALPGGEAEQYDSSSTIPTAADIRAHRLALRKDRLRKGLPDVGNGEDTLPPDLFPPPEPGDLVPPPGDTGGTYPPPDQIPAPPGDGVSWDDSGGQGPAPYYPPQPEPYPLPDFIQAPGAITPPQGVTAPGFDTSGGGGGAFTAPTGAMFDQAGQMQPDQAVPGGPATASSTAQAPQEKFNWMTALVIGGIIFGGYYVAKLGTKKGGMWAPKTRTRRRYVRR